jgi:hypothetical protein
MAAVRVSEDLSNLDMSKLGVEDPKGSGEFGYDDPVAWGGDEPNDSIVKDDDEKEPNDGDIDFGAEKKEETVEESGSGKKSDEDDPNWKVRAAHYQSQNKKLSDEVSELKTKTGLLTRVDKMLREDPELVDIIDAKLAGKSISSVKDVAKVEFPTRPKEFDPYEAYNNESSESFKYRVEYEKALVQQAAATAVAAVDGKVRQRESAEATIAEQKAAKTALDSEMVKLGISEEQQQLFWSWAKGGMINGPQDAIKAWAAINGISLRAAPRIREKNESKPPAARGGSGDKDRKTDESKSGGLLSSLYGGGKPGKPRY